MAFRKFKEEDTMQHCCQQAIMALFISCSGHFLCCMLNMVNCFDGLRSVSNRKQEKTDAGWIHMFLFIFSSGIDIAKY